MLFDGRVSGSDKMIEHRVEAVKNTYGNILKSETLIRVLTYWEENGFRLVSTSVVTDEQGTEVLLMFFTKDVC